MPDVLTPAQRHRCMSNIKSKNTKPELFVRSLVHRAGFRFRLHKASLPGKPDLVFSRLKKVIFVHGCFWHKHNCRLGKVIPKTNHEFWEKKREATRQRDLKALLLLRSIGWQSIVIWECSLKFPTKLEKRILQFLNHKPTVAKSP